MALIKLGAFVTDVRGKVGGTVFSRTKSGAIAKNRVIPSNPRTSAQQSVRGFFGTLSSLWRTLSQDQRERWNELAQELSFQNRVGDATKISGLALYQKFNGNLNTVGSPTISVPVQPQGVSAIAINNVEADNADGVFSLTVDFDVISEAVADTVYAVFATPAISPGISNYNNRLRLIGSVEAAGENIVSVEYLAKFGVPSVGSRVAVRILPINSVTGESGTAVQGDVIVVAS